MFSILKKGNYLQYGKKLIPSLAGAQFLQLIAEDNFDASTTSTTAQALGTITIHDVQLGDAFIIVTEDNAGRRTGHFYKEYNILLVKGSGTATTNFYVISDNAGSLAVSVSSAGVYAASGTYSNTGDLDISIVEKYGSSTSRTIDGNYNVKVYKLNI